jgi:uncharacterized phage infection (PIP) family protein YhgE
MKKPQLRMVSDVLERLDKEGDTFTDIKDKIIDRLDQEITRITELQTELQTEHDELSEAKQEGEEGTKLSEEIEVLAEILGEFDSLKDEIEGDPFEDLINKIKEIEGVSDA